MQPTTVAIAVGALLAFVGVAFGNYYFNLLRPHVATSTDQYATTTPTTPSTTTNAPSMPPTSSHNPVVTLKTNKGDIKIELFMDTAPVTAGNFLKLANENFYDNTKFHRVIKDFMIQGGDPLSKDDSMKTRWGTGGPGYTIKDEFAPGLSNVKGTISMANAGPNTGGSQFFINQANNTFLDGKHAVFGKVVEGLALVDTIANAPTGARDVPNDAIIISDVAVSP